MSDMQDKLQDILNTIVDNKKIFNTNFTIQKNDFEWSGKAGENQNSDKFFVASITKMFVAVVIIQLINEQKLSFESKLVDLLPEHNIHSLHIYKNYNYTSQITVRHLLAHTSGLADYFQAKMENSKTLRHNLIAGNNRGWSFEEVLNWAGKQRPKFIPGARNKANYSATNYQILGKIIEKITGLTLQQTLQNRIFEPLGMTGTYLYNDPLDTQPAKMYHKNTQLNNPLAVISSWADGAGVSTSKDLIIFIQKFFDGSLFPTDYLPQIMQFNRIFYPLKTGLGLLRFEIGIFRRLKIMPVMFGHSGLSGALVYADLQNNFFIAGTINQTTYQSIPFIVMAKFLAKINV